MLRLKKTKAPKPQARTMTIDEVARELGVSRNSAYEAAKSGELPVVRLGKRILVPRAAVEKMLAVEASKTAA